MTKAEHDLNAIVGRVIKGEYKKRGMRMEEIAEAIDVPYSTLRRKLAGGAPLFATEFVAIARVIGIDPGPVLTEAEQLYSAMSSASPKHDDITTKRQEKEAEARAMTPDQLAQVKKRAATNDQELLTDEPEAP